ncbi:hypothetical protein SEA_TIMINATOR_43 [Arthrobacter phage Timinator]|uniref:Uncharacterized protein n=2 Tax=Marthavirus barretlemon TaxID=2560300 RepID=A0A386KN74_9CAUD|nr:hypothetical protein SEA_TIMINATOR_43 [Arthrobacter phage Timinator]AYD86514.1 hypothetical protein SEA_LEEROYJ_43 [Arthrobacter phage LeeroyJ]
MTHLSIADARARVFRLKQARVPLRENIESLQEHVEHTQKQIEDLKLIDDTMADAENAAQVDLDAALERHEDEAAEKLRVQIEAEERRRDLPVVSSEKYGEPRKIKDNPQA